MKVDWTNWRLQGLHWCYPLAWGSFWAWCLFGPLLFSWQDMGRYILSMQVGFAFLGWATWSKRGGVIFNKPPVEGIKR